MQGRDSLLDSLPPTEDKVKLQVVREQSHPKSISLTVLLKLKRFSFPLVSPHRGSGEEAVGRQGEKESLLRESMDRSRVLGDSKTMGCCPPKMDEACYM